MLLTAITFFVTISILIIVHELGHFLVAKKAGIKVEEFGFGYPPRILGKKIGETVYSLNWIPFGGFVRLFGQERIDPQKRQGAFWAKSKKARLAVIIAGVVANLLLSFSIFSLFYLVSGIPTETDRVIIEAVVVDSPADQAGIKPGDVVLTLDGEGVDSVDDLIEKTGVKKGEAIDLVVDREDKEQTFNLIPRVETSEDEGPLGVVISSYELKRFPFWQMPILAAREGAKETWGWLVTIVSSLTKMVKDWVVSGKAPQDIAGPIGILQVSGHVARSGVMAVLQFIAILSINLAVLNILPFPALDGGHFLFLVIETVTGRRSNDQVARWVNGLGMAILVFLMLMVTIRDVQRALTTTELGARLQSFWPF